MGLRHRDDRALRAATTALRRWRAACSRGAAGDWDLDAPHPTPVVFVRRLPRSRDGFRILGQALADAGARNTARFSYGPTLDYQRLAGQLGRTLEEICAATDARRVDVVGHSLGGLATRFLVDSGDGDLVRRLVTLGSPYYASVIPSRELAIFAADDPRLPVPDTDRRRRST